MITPHSVEEQRIFSRWFKVVIFNFLIAASIGVLMRLAFVVEIPGFNYRNYLHAHSHVALLGWLYGAFYIIILYVFDLNITRYRRLFWGTQLSVLGMLLSFPIQGYGLISISFSTIHILLSYVFVVRVVRELKIKKRPKMDSSEKFLLAALFFLVFSTLGTWALGPIMNSSLRGTAWYYSAIQFFLHFQFNGWFVFTTIAVFLRIMKTYGVLKQEALLNLFYAFLGISCFLTYALAVTWSNPDKLLFWVNSLGVIVQLFAWCIFCRWIWVNQDGIKNILQPHVYVLWRISFVCLSCKVVIQSLVSIPTIAVISYTIHNFVIGFIHLLMLGGLSIFIFGYLEFIGIWRHRKIQIKTGVWIFIWGVATTEALLFYQGCRLWLNMGFVPGYYLILFLCSLLLPIGIGLYWLAVLKK